MNIRPTLILQEVKIDRANNGRKEKRKEVWLNKNGAYVKMDVDAQMTMIRRGIDALELEYKQIAAKWAAKTIKPRKKVVKKKVAKKK